jgi:hypothetical protein
VSACVISSSPARLLAPDAEPDEEPESRLRNAWVNHERMFAALSTF